MDAIVAPKADITSSPLKTTHRHHPHDSTTPTSALIGAGSATTTTTSGSSSRITSPNAAGSSASTLSVGNDADSSKIDNDDDCASVISELKPETEEWVENEKQVKERDDYEAFIKSESDKLAKEEAAEIEQAHRENERKTRDQLFKDAMVYIEKSMQTAAAYQQKMQAAALGVIKDPSQLHLHQQPSLFTGGTLRDYQLDGFHWIGMHHFFGESMILADDMGLGKTIQVIAYLAWLRECFSEESTVLIVCPLSTLGNWVDEIRRFTPTLPVLRYHGTQEEREELREKYILQSRHHHHHGRSSSGGSSSKGGVDLYHLTGAAASASVSASASSASSSSSSSPSKLATKKEKASKAATPTGALVIGIPIVVTTYEVAARDFESLASVQWRTLIIDEGHRLKNEAGVTRRLLREYSKQAATGEQVRLLLTGTPVQNDMVELWSLCNFIMPSVFRSKDEFKTIYSFVGMGTSAGTDYLRQQEQKNLIISKLHALLERYLLRRTKREVALNLPPKVEALVYTPLTKVQLRLLRALKRGNVEDELKAMGWVSRDDWSKAATVSGLNPQMNLRKICVHPYFFAEPPPNPKTGAETDEQIITSCGKMKVLDTMLRKLRKDGHKVLIFSQFKTMIEILADYFEYAGEKAVGTYRMITGDTPSLERDQSIRDFNKDPTNEIFAFLLSTKAGGLGINLVAADTVIFYDSDWNPKSDEQAQDRAHRIGQVRPVVVYRFITEGASVERRMLRIAAGKASLGRVVLQEGKYLIHDEGGGGGSGSSSSSGSARQTSSPGALTWLDTSDSAGGGGGSSSSSFLPSPSGETALIDSVTGQSRYGKCSEKLLEYWLRLDVADDAAIMRGIPSEELDMILDRGRALQAGKHVADVVEEQLLAHDDGSGKEKKSSSSSSSSSATTPSSSSTTTTTSTSSSSSTTTITTSIAAAAPLTPSRSSKRKTPGSSPSTLPPAAAATLEKSRLGALEAELGGKWEAMAMAAPYTPSKGEGYEFVYHQASRGLLPLPPHAAAEKKTAAASVHLPTTLSALSEGGEGLYRYPVTIDGDGSGGASSSSSAAANAEAVPDIRSLSAAVMSISGGPPRPTIAYFEDTKVPHKRGAKSKPSTAAAAARKKSGRVAKVTTTSRPPQKKKKGDALSLSSAKGKRGAKVTTSSEEDDDDDEEEEEESESDEEEEEEEEEDDDEDDDNDENSRRGRRGSKPAASKKPRSASTSSRKPQKR